MSFLEIPADQPYCDTCQNTGTVDCLCGGDLCVCDNHGEIPCPACDGPALLDLVLELRGGELHVKAPRGPTTCVICGCRELEPCTTGEQIPVRWASLDPPVCTICHRFDPDLVRPENARNLRNPDG